MPTINGEERPDLCETCREHFSECLPSRVIFGIDLDKKTARTMSADAVIECSGYYKKER